MIVTAKSRYLRTSAQKLRLSADLVRQKPAIESLHILQAKPKKSAGLVYDTLKSAIANAENNHSMTASELVISEIRVDQGPMRKRYRPRSRGMANQIQHKTSHLTIKLDKQAPVEIAKPKPVSAKAKANKAEKSSDKHETTRKQETV